MADSDQLTLYTLVAALSATAAPIAAAIVKYFIDRSTKKQNWAREDKVAAQAAEAARLLLEAQAKTSAQNIDTQDKLKEIHTLSVSTHTLVNSNLTREMDERLVALKGQHLAIKRLNELQPSKENEETLNALMSMINHLETMLAERGATLKASDEGQRGDP